VDLLHFSSALLLAFTYPVKAKIGGDPPRTAQIVPQSTGHSHFPTTKHIVVIVRLDLGLGLLRHNHVRLFDSGIVPG
jgi:hypothetical protein